MYLSRVTYKDSSLGKACAFSRFKLGLYKSHQQIWQLFSNDSIADGKSPFLFREEYKSINGKKKKHYYVLSKEMPKKLEKIFNIETKKFNPILKKGMKLGFVLRVNPTICVYKHGAKRGTRHDILMHAKKQLKLKEGEGHIGLNLNEYFEKVAVSWLLDQKRLEKWGISFQVNPLVKGWKSEKTFNSTNNKISFTWVDYEGVLSVEDPELFMQVLQNGVGRAKAFGCGLFMIKRVYD